MRSTTAIAIGLLFLAAACGGSTSGGGGGGGSAGAKGVPVDSCYRQCEAQTKVQGCTPIVSLPDCKTLCDQLAAGVPSSCATQFSEYYDCSASEGFMCFASFVAQSTACNPKKDAFDACQNGGTKSTCEGQLSSGVCPQVSCPCPSGSKLVSGFEQSNGTCKCYDATTCVDFFCD